MPDSPSSPPEISPRGRELARILRMRGTQPGERVRYGMLEALWLRHEVKPSLKDLDAAVVELVAAKLLMNGRPDGVIMTEGAIALR